MKSIIYTLEDNNSIRYIGKTINLDKRYKSHIRESSSLRTHKEKWINNVLSKGDKITMEILDICDEKDSSEIEIYWISQFKCWGFDLVNLTCGGDGGSPMLGKNHSCQTKSKMSEIAKFQNRNIGGWNKGLTMSDESKRKISLANQGREISNETKLKISNSNKGNTKKPMSEETKLKISNKKKGTTSPNKGKKFSDERKLEMSLVRKGIKRSDDVKKKMSESRKIIWRIKTPNNDILDFLGYDSFKQFVSKNCLNVSVTTLKSYGKNKGWEVISKLKK